MNTKSINTKIIKIDINDINLEQLEEAGRAIRDGKLVAFPTETVYGLGADATNDKALLKIFHAKNRPYNDPLIVHIHSMEEMNDIVVDFPDIAKKLGKLFWPGPLTMIFKKSKLISDVVTSGLDTVAIRVPNHKIALALIKMAQRPIAAPSANLFSYTSPTKADHVISDLNGKIDIIIDSGKTSIGVESTVLDVTSFPLKILRLGGVTFERLKEVIPDIIIADNNIRVRRSPGMMGKHYSPKAKLILVEEEGEKIYEKILKLALQYKNEGNKVGVITCNENLSKYPGFVVKAIGGAHDLDSCAHNLYESLRNLDEEKCDIIISEKFHNIGLGRAIMDRLRRAAK